MAKEKEDKPAAKPAKPEFKYGVKDVADKLGIQVESCRAALRNKNIKKAGKSYGWNTQAELLEVVEKLKAAAPEKKAAKPAAKKATLAPKKKAA